MRKIKQYNVMVVEDEPLLLRNIARRIDELDTGFRVVCQAMDGARAIELLESNEIHLIVTDICMPVVSGLELLKTVHSRYPHIKVVLLSGHAEFSYAQEALRAGALDYILKPVDTASLEQILTYAKLALGKSYQLEEDSNLSGGSAEEVMEVARRYLREHYAEDVDMSEFAAKLGFSAAYLTKLFHKYEGCSPVKYLTNLRLTEAKHLLVSTDLSIREVGDRIGYPDQFYFSNVFRKATGSSPSVYRKNNLEE